MKKFVWTFQIEVDEDAVADGLDFADIDMKTALLRAFPLVHGDTFEIVVVSAPAPEAIREIQGYPAYPREWSECCARGELPPSYSTGGK